MLKQFKPSSEPSVSCSNIKDHWSQRTITNTTIMKKFEISQELLKCDTETRSEQMLLEKTVWVHMLNSGLPQTFNLKKKQSLWSSTKQDMPVQRSSETRRDSIGSTAGPSIKSTWDWIWLHTYSYQLFHFCLLPYAHL